uniref:Uncharacterized protein n=1 Tax=Rhizophora mucronata TaxID=61149 RepID=A0A2P2JV61_RHIMU
MLLFHESVFLLMHFRDLFTLLEICRSWHILLYQHHLRPLSELRTGRPTGARTSSRQWQRHL